MIADNIKSDFRNPSIVMEDLRLGSMHQNSLSFVRSIVRGIARGNWDISQSLWDMDNNGLGVAIYKVMTEYSEYNFVVFSQFIKDEERIDRVIAEKWDVTFSLVKGNIDDAFLKQMKKNIPLQEAGRNTNNSLVLARANKSVRVFDHIVKSLKAGQQPNISLLTKVGYVLRTTAVYGNGKFGIADFGVLKDNPDFKLSFSAQMFACYMLRQFSVDWVNYIASQNSETAVELNEKIAEYMGVGNATGLGMAPYLINHPQIVDKWITVREKAIATASAQTITKDKYTEALSFIKMAIKHLKQIDTSDDTQKSLNTICVEELSNIIKMDIPKDEIWKDYIKNTMYLSLESQEILLSCIVELYPSLVNGFEQEMNAVESITLGDGLLVSDMRLIIESRYKWATDIDFKNNENASYWFWYRSEVKEEPRLGVRTKEKGIEKEMRLDIARQVSIFNEALKQKKEDMTMVDFLMQNPKYRVIARRVWTLGTSSMGDIQMNTLDKNMLPIHLLRCKLAVFGATKFDPRSDKWVQVTLFQGAPLLQNIHDRSWIFPLQPEL